MTEPFKFSDGQLAYTAEELISLCQKSPAESLDYLMREDFEKWLDYIGKSDLAAKARQIRQASLADGDRIKQFISQCQITPVAAEKTSATTIAVSQPKAAVAPTTTKATVAPATAKVPTASTAPKATVAPTAAKVPTASTAQKATVAPAAAKVPTASTAIKKPNPLASLFQKLFGKK